IIFDELGAAPIILALLYLYVMGVASSKLSKMRKASTGGLNTEKLFVMTMLLACVTRVMGFVTIGECALNLQSIRVGYDPHRHDGGDSGADDDDDYRQDSDQRFYDKCVLVLFDFPDFVALSAYALLAVVWAEAFLASRSHWLSARRYRQGFLMAYLVFNAALYMAQLLLYGALFLPSSPTGWAARALYAALTTVNFGLPLLLAALFMYLTVSFSGFPYRTERALRRQALAGRALLIWTAGRVCWGAFALTAALQYSLAASSAAEKAAIYSVLIVALFLVTELWPFAAALDDDVLAVVGEAAAAATA
ncbi:hypothetical protein JKP88DRAFT_133551, partial [Tribonema minus]